MLRRLGNKSKLLPKLLELFPDDVKTFIDMFMGSGAVTFAMVNRAKYIIANDKDADIFNLFQVVREQKEALVEAIQTMPIHENLFQYWRSHEESDAVWKAARFLMLSNFGYLGKSETLKFDSIHNEKNGLLPEINGVFCKLAHVQFMSYDFRDVLKKINWREKDFGRPANHKERAFIYADPPYLETGNNYAGSFTEEDSADLFEILVNSGIRFAMSEFDHPFILSKAQEYGLYVAEIGERRNLKNRRMEILVTNYEPLRKQITVFDVLNQSAGRCNNHMQQTKTAVNS